MNAASLLERMLEIPSPSGAERPLAEFLAGVMEEQGMESRIDEVGNVIGRTGRGDGPAVLLVGHLDTVAGEVPVRLEEDRLYGRGAADAQGPLAAMILACAANRDFPGDLIVAGVVEEETPGSLGAVHLSRTLDRPDALIVGEPGGWSGVTAGYKGKFDLTYRVRRPATHPTNPAEKATEAAAAFWQDAVSALGPDRSHAAFDRPAVTLCSMAGDIEAAELEISYRIPIGFDNDELLKHLEARCRGGEIEVLNVIPAVRTNRQDPVIRALSAAIRTLGGKPSVKLKTATSDMNTLGAVWDLPMATYGPGDSALDHTADEHISLDDYLAGIAVLTRAVGELPAGLPQRTRTS
jgi:[amino group carrier protein]-lysine/ornithine hydrolase